VARISLKGGSKISNNAQPLALKDALWFKKFYHFMIFLINFLPDQYKYK
jgi:hypothetical protein